MPGGELRATGGARRELPAGEDFLVGAARQLRLARGLSGELEIPLPPGVEVVIRSEPSGEGGQLSTQVALDLRFQGRLWSSGSSGRLVCTRGGTRLSGGTRLRRRP